MSKNQRKSGVYLSYIYIGLTNLIGLIYTPFLLKMLGQAEYGLFSLATSIIASLSVLDFGVGNATVRYTAFYKSKNQIDQLHTLFGMLLVLYLLICLVSIGGGIYLSTHVNDFYGSSMTPIELQKVRIITLILTCSVSLSFPLSIFESIVIAYENFVFQRILQILRTILQPLLMVPVLLAGFKSIALVTVLSSISILYLIANLVFCIRKLRIKIVLFKFNLPLLREIAQYSFWVFLGLIVNRLFWSSGQIILGAFVGASAVAIYAVLIQFKNYLSSFSLAISSVFLPKITSMESNEQISSIFIKISRIQYVIISFIVSGFILFGRSFILLWAGPDYDESYFTALILLIPLTVPLVQTAGIAVLQAKNKLRFRSILYIITATVGCILSILLSREFGSVGCAIGIAIPIVVGHIVVMNIYYFKEVKLDIPLFWKEIAAMTPQIVIMDVAFFLLLRMMNWKLVWSTLILHISVFTAIYTVITYYVTLNKYEKDLIVRELNLLKIKLKCLVN